MSEECNFILEQALMKAILEVAGNLIIGHP